MAGSEANRVWEPNLSGIAGTVGANRGKISRRAGFLPSGHTRPAATRGLAAGFWGIADHTLEWVGKGVIRVLTGGRSLREDAAYAIIGAALLSGAFGAVLGFSLSSTSENVSTGFGTILGSLLGICLGILFGSFVEIIDWSIEDLIRSLNSK